MSTSTETPPLQPITGLEEHLARWVSDGVVTPEQADGIRAEERALVAAPRPPARVTEALGYLGGLLVVVASLLLVGRVWPHLSLGGRLALVGGGSVLLLAAGALVPHATTEAAGRLRSVLWVLSTGTATFFVGLLGHEVWDVRGPDLALLVSGTAAAYAGALWALTRAPLQQAACFAALSGTAASALVQLHTTGDTAASLSGLGILVVATLWVVLALGERLQPRRLALGLGGVGAVVGSVVLGQSGWGRFAALTAVVCLAGAGLVLDELALLGAGAVGLLLVLPTVMEAWFPGAVAAPLALLFSGAVLVLVALRALRRRAG